MVPSRANVVHRALSILVVVLCALVVGAIPGSSSPPAVVTLRVPTLPAEVSDRDASLQVTVRAENQDAPLFGARVLALVIVTGHAFIAGDAQSDAAGRATLRDLPRGEYWVLSDAPGRARASASLVLVAGERTLEMTLGAEHHLDVEVNDEQGGPIPAVEVEIQGGDPLPVGARSGTDGIAHAGRLGPGPWIVTARARGYEEITQRGVREGQKLRVTLRRLGALLVTVLGSDEVPAAGAHVVLEGASLWPARTAETGKDGTLRVGALAAGSYALRATQGDLASPIELGVALSRGEEKAVTLHLGPGVRVAVRVTDDADGPGIAGARVSLVENGLSPFPVEATTDSDGRATLGPIAAGPASLAARAEGFVARGAVTVPEPLRGAVTIALVRAGTLTGRIVDVRGFPVDGASLQIVGTDFSGAPIDDDPRRERFRDAHFDATLRGPTPLLSAGELGVMPGPVPPIPHGFSTATVLPTAPGKAPVPLEPWITRDDGTFRASPVSPGRIRALVRHPQFVEAVSDLVTLTSGGEAHVDIVLHAGGTLEGRVVDTTGRAVAAARVAVAAMRGSMERATKSATDGSFAFAALPGDITVMVSRDDETGDVLVRVPVSIPEGDKRTITVTLPDARPALEARVVDTRGYPIDAVQISATSLDPALPLRTTAFTNARGEAAIPGARGLSLRIEARAPNFAPLILTADAAASPLLLTMTSAESARGDVRARDGRGEPIGGAEVVLYTDSGARHTSTAPDGTFVVTELSAGPLRLHVRAPGFAPQDVAFVLAPYPSHQAFVVPTIELARDGSVEGVVVDERGNPVQGARVARDRVPVYLAVARPPSGVAVTDVHGHFRLAELPDGTVTLEVYAPDVGRARAENVRVIAGRSRDTGKIALLRDDEAVKDSASSGGVAITLGETSGEPRQVGVVLVAESSEAERLGIAPGDLILELDGATVQGMVEARARLNGPIGDDVVLKLKRGEKVESLRVPREQVRR